MTTRSLAWRMFVRSFFVQASWNFHRMQNLGFFLIIFPALVRRSPRGSPALAEASLRHLQLYNSHPYFAGLVAGTVVQEEACGEMTLAAGLKRSLMCSLGGIGDEFFWAHLRPLAALCALPFALQGLLWAPAILLVSYNIPHLAVRGYGVGAALRRGREIIGVLQHRRFTRWIAPFAALIAALAGFIVGMTAAGAPRGFAPERGLAGAVVVGGAFPLFVLLQIRGLSPERLLAGLSALAVLAGVVRVVIAS